MHAQLPVNSNRFAFSYSGNKLAYAVGTGQQLVCPPPPLLPLLLHTRAQARQRPRPRPFLAFRCVVRLRCRVRG